MPEKEPEETKGEEFEGKIQYFIDRLVELQDKIDLEGKIKHLAPVQIPLEDGSVRTFPPGFYFLNLNEKDLEKIDAMAEEWKEYVNLGIAEHANLMEKYAGTMEAIYSFLEMRYKPIIKIKKNEGRIVAIYSEHLDKKQKEMRKFNERLMGNYRGQIEKAKEEFFEEMEGEEEEDEEIERLERINKDLTEKDIEEMKENLNIEAGLRKIEMEYEEKTKEKIKELQASVRNYFTNEKAAKIYELMGLPKRNPRKAKNYKEYKETERERAFWEIVNQGIKNRDKAKERRK